MTHLIPETPPEYDQTRIVQRPDGFYWQSRKESGEYGPFPTLMEAVQDMQFRGDSEIEPGETLKEAEADLGITDWIDADTGEPAQEGVPRLEDH